MQDKHVVIFRGKEDRDIFINKINYSKTVYQIDGIGGKAESDDIVVGNQQGTDWILATYIVDNYDNLHEYTIFTQADPSDHVHEMLLALDSTFTDKYGCFCYARSLYEQYTLTWARLHATTLSAQRLGMDYKNSLNTRKFIYICEPGTTFYVHRDRIRERPKSFYENIIKCDNDKDFFEYVINYNHPQWLYDEINKLHPNLRSKSNKDKIVELTLNVPRSYTLNANKLRDDYFGVSTEPLWALIFSGKQKFEFLENAQSKIGNTLSFSARNSELNIIENSENGFFSNNLQKTILNFKLLENSWFDWDCPYYLKWREKLIEKTIWEGEQRGFDGKQMLEFYKRIGYKHISL